MRGLLMVAFALLAACAPVLGEDFEGYVARPTTCDLVTPRATDPHRHVVCGSNQTCVLAGADGSPATTETHCFPSSGDALPFAACDYTTDCGPGMGCNDRFGCLPYCRLGEAACAGGAQCTTFSDGSLVNGGDNLGYCTPAACDPLSDACPGKCVFQATDRPACAAKPGANRAGAECTWDYDCARGLACGRQGVCTPHCRMDASTADCNGTRCEPIEGENLSINGVPYGYCER